MPCKFNFSRSNDKFLSQDEPKNYLFETKKFISPVIYLSHCFKASHHRLEIENHGKEKKKNGT